MLYLILIELLATRHHKYYFLQAIIYNIQLFDSAAACPIYGAKGEGRCNDLYHYGHFSGVLLQLCGRAGAGVSGAEIQGRESDHTSIYMDGTGSGGFVCAIQTL